MLLFSSTFVVPISSSATSHDSPKPILIANAGGVPFGVPNLPFTTAKIGGPGPVILSGQRVNEISPPLVSPFGGSSSSQAPASGAFVEGSNVDPNAMNIKQIVSLSSGVVSPEAVSITASNSLWGSSDSLQVVAQGPSPANPVLNPPFFTLVSGGGAVSFTVQIRTGGEFFGPNLPDGAVQVQIAGFENFNSSNLQSYSSSLSLTSVTSAIPGLFLDSSKRRSRSQIYVEILELMKRGPMTPFEIAFYGRLNHKRTKEYAELLKRSGYLEAVVEDERLSYVLTKNGIAFLERVKMLFEENGAPTEYVNYYSSG